MQGEISNKHIYINLNDENHLQKQGRVKEQSDGVQWDRVVQELSHASLGEPIVKSTGILQATCKNNCGTFLKLPNRTILKLFLRIQLHELKSQINHIGN